MNGIEGTKYEGELGRNVLSSEPDASFVDASLQKYLQL